MKTLHAFVASCCFLVSCAPASQVEPKPSNVQPQQEQSRVEGSPLRSLFAEKAKILEHRAPRYTGTGEKSEALSFLNQDLKAWLFDRKQSTDTLVQRLEAARRSLDENTGLLALQAEAELYVDLSREFISAATTAIPASMKNDFELEKAYIGAVVDAAQVPMERAQVALTGCLQPVTHPNAEARSSCSALQNDLNRIKAPATWMDGRNSP